MQPAIGVLGFDLDMAIALARNPFRRVQPQQVAPRDAVQHAPYLGIGIAGEVCWRRLAPGPAFQIEPEPEPLDPGRPAFERPDAAADAKRAVVHVGAIGEIPDLLGWSADKANTAQWIVNARNQPGLGGQSPQPAPHCEDRLS